MFSLANPACVSGMQNKTERWISNQVLQWKTSASSMYSLAKPAHVIGMQNKYRNERQIGLGSNSIVREPFRQALSEILAQQRSMYPALWMPISVSHGFLPLVCILAPSLCYRKAEDRTGIKVRMNTAPGTSNKTYKTVY